MTEPERQLERSLSRVEARWDAARSERTLRDLPRRRRMRRLRTAAPVVTALALLGGGWLALHEGPEQPVASHRTSAPAATERGASTVTAAAAAAVDGAPTARDASDRHLQLQDGSSVSMLDAHTRVVVADARPGLHSLRLDAGSARFIVTPNAERVFQVAAGEVTVEVLGTIFELTRADVPGADPERAGTAAMRGRTHVAVQEGRVAVRWRGGRRELSAGEAGWFPPASAGAQHNPAQLGAQQTPQNPEPTAQSKRRTAARGWREHAERGEFKRAYGLLQAPDARVGSDVHELLLAADAARLSGHPAAALPYLRQVVDQHPGDARAPLAAFTLGGVLMNQLGLPREAETAYRRAREGTRSPALAQDALARQVEAAHRAGDDALARRLALQYVREYPAGRRIHAVRGFGGLR